MFIIVGLGNPTPEYEGTRHNVGFEVIDALARKYNIDVDTKKHRAYIGKGMIEGQKVILAKPQTYMNLSGESVRSLLDYYKVDEEQELLVIYDDISLGVGQIRIRAKGSAGGHNGIKNIIAGLDQALTGEEHIMVLLETMSGKGTEIGSRFEELKEIREGCAHPEKIGICLDTCHVFAAGYDIVEHLDAVLSEFDRVLGLSLLRAVHLNDSMMPFGSNKDRHAALGAGEIGFPALLRVLEHPELKDLPFYLETPFDDAGHAAEIRMLREKLAEHAGA